MSRRILEKGTACPKCGLTPAIVNIQTNGDCVCIRCQTNITEAQKEKEVPSFEEFWATIRQELEPMGIYEGSSEYNMYQAGARRTWSEIFG